MATPGFLWLLGVLFAPWMILVVEITGDSRVKRHMHCHHVQVGGRH